MQIIRATVTWERVGDTSGEAGVGPMRAGCTWQGVGGAPAPTALPHTAGPTAIASSPNLYNTHTQHTFEQSAGAHGKPCQGLTVLSIHLVLGGFGSHSQYKRVRALRKGVECMSPIVVWVSCRSIVFNAIQTSTNNAMLFNVYHFKK